MNKRFRASYKIAIGFALLALLATYGYRFANDLVLGREHFAPLAPGDVNIVGVDTSAGYRILVQNRVAKLVMGSAGSFKAGEMSDESRSEDAKKFIPIKDMLRSLQGNEESLSYFVMKMNDISDEEWPATAKVWRADKLQAAFGGDLKLSKQLEEDINLHLDGTPLDHVSKNAIFSGVFVETPVPIRMGRGESERTVTAYVRRWYRPQLVQDVTEKDLKNKNYTMNDVAIQYAAEAKRQRDGERGKEDVKAAITQWLGQAEIDSLRAVPEQILRSVDVVVNNAQIVGASYSGEEGPKGKMYSLKLKLNNEGRKRMWQFTRGKVGSQLLVTVNGVAIAAPYIEHAISDDELLVTKMEDEDLVQNAVDTINSKRASK